MSGIAKSTVRMANQIARNFEAIGHAAAIDATADHISSFWDPRMKAAAFELLDQSDSGFTNQARAALKKLSDQGPPPSQTRATQFNHADEAGHSDAG